MKDSSSCAGEDWLVEKDLQYEKCVELWEMKNKLRARLMLVAEEKKREEEVVKEKLDNVQLEKKEKLDKE